MIAQRFVDANYHLLGACISWPGSVHDARAFAHSNLYKKTRRRHLALNQSMTIPGARVPLNIIKDSACPTVCSHGS